jgi:hypothetical protein
MAVQPAVADWFRVKITTPTYFTCAQRYQTFRLCNPEKLFSYFIPDKGPFVNEREKTDWRLAHWGTIHEATNVRIVEVKDKYYGEEHEFNNGHFILTFTSHAVPYQFIRRLSQLFDGYSRNQLSWHANGIFGEYNDQNTILHSDGRVSRVGRLVGGSWGHGRGAMDTHEIYEDDDLGYNDDGEEHWDGLDDDDEIEEWLCDYDDDYYEYDDDCEERWNEDSKDEVSALPPGPFSALSPEERRLAVNRLLLDDDEEDEDEVQIDSLAVETVTVEKTAEAPAIGEKKRPQKENDEEGVSPSKRPKPSASSSIQIPLQTVAVPQVPALPPVPFSALSPEFLAVQSAVVLLFKERGKEEVRIASDALPFMTAALSTTQFAEESKDPTWVEKGLQALDRENKVYIANDQLHRI